VRRESGGIAGLGEEEGEGGRRRGNKGSGERQNEGVKASGEEAGLGGGWGEGWDRAEYAWGERGRG